MSTHTDPSNNEYIELDKKLGAAEYELAAEIAEIDEVTDTAESRSRCWARIGEACFG